MVARQSQNLTNRELDPPSARSERLPQDVDAIRSSRRGAGSASCPHRIKPVHKDLKSSNMATPLVPARLRLGHPLAEVVTWPKSGQQCRIRPAVQAVIAVLKSDLLGQRLHYSHRPSYTFQAATPASHMHSKPCVPSPPYGMKTLIFSYKLSMARAALGPYGQRRIQVQLAGVGLWALLEPFSSQGHPNRTNLP